jgi:hypothetical protein
MNTLKQIGMGLALISTLAMTGCGGSSSNDSDGGGATATTEEGTFVDSPVMGLHYKTDTQDGYTDSKGTFKYNIGEKVEFSLGDLSLGKVEAGAVISPYTLAGVEDENDAVKAGSNHATNIALLLQNLDFQRGDDTILDLSKFQNHKFTDEIKTKIKLDQEMTDMEGVIAGLMNNDFKDLIAPGATALNHADVKVNMKKHVTAAVENHKKSNKLSDLYGKTYVKVKCSELLGECNTGSQISNMNNKSYSLNTGKTSINIPYTSKGGTIIKLNHGTWKNYQRFSDTNKDIIKVCDGNTLEKAKACFQISTYVLASVKDKYIKAKEKDMESKLAKTLVTDFKDIQIPLYQLRRNSSDNIHYGYIEIDSNGSFKGVDDDEKYNAVFNNTTGTLHVTGIDDGGSNYDKKDIVYKYDLSGKTITKKQFINNAIFGNYNNLAYYLPNTTFTFAQGSSMYCPILHGECYVNEVAIDQMLKEAKLDARNNS